MSDSHPADNQPRKLRSISFLLFGASGVCGLIAYDKYRTAVVTTKVFSDAISIEGVDFKPTVPNETWICGVLSLLLAVAALRCVLQWYRSSPAEQPEGALLP